MRNRDMYYQNLNQGFQSPGQYIPPSGYNVNTNYQAYGSNMMPNQYAQFNQNNYQSFEDYVNEKLDRIDKQIRNLDTRLQKLESGISETTDNIYMI